MADTTKTIRIQIQTAGAAQAKQDIAGVGSASSDASGSLAGFAQQLLGIGSAAGAIAAIAALSDEYTIFANKVDSVTQNVSQQAAVQSALLDVADTTRNSLADVADVYQRISIATQDYNLSTQQQIELTQELLEASSLMTGSNANLRESISQLSVGLQEGEISGRQFRTFIKDQPILLDAFSKSLGLTVAQLKSLSSENRIGASELLAGLQGAEPAIADQFSQQTETIEQDITKIHNDLSSIFKDATPFLTTFLDDFENGLRIIDNGLKSTLGALRSPADQQFLNQFNSDQQTGRNRLLPAPNASNNNIAPSLAGTYNPATLPTAPGAVPRDATSLSQNQLDLVTQINQKLSDRLELAQAGVTLSQADIAALTVQQELYSKGLVTQQQYNDLSETEAGQQTIKLNNLKIINQSEFDSLTSKAKSAVLLKDEQAVLQAIGGNQQDFNDKIAAANALIDYQHGKLSEIQAYIHKITEQQLALNTNSISDQTQLGGLKIQDSQNDFSDIAQDRQDSWNQAGGAAQKYNDLVIAINANEKAGLISTTQATQQLNNAQLTLLATQTDVASGFKAGFLTVGNEISDFATQSKQVVTDAFDGMENAIVSLTETGKANFADLASSIAGDLEKLLLNQAFASLLGGLAGSTNPLFAAIGGAFGFGAGGANAPHKAMGGGVSAGVGYMTGEQGPEMFIPQNSGTIIPHGALMGNSEQKPPVVNVSIGLTSQAVADSLGGDEGAKMVVTHLSKNKRTVRQIVAS